MIVYKKEYCQIYYSILLKLALSVIEIYCKSIQLWQQCLFLHSWFRKGGRKRHNYFWSNKKVIRSCDVDFAITQILREK